MAKIGKDLRNIGKRTRKPKAIRTEELPKTLQEKGWTVSHAPKTQKNWEKALGSVLKCPQCGHEFDRSCKRADRDTAYWSKDMLNEDNTGWAEYQLRGGFVLADAFPQTPKGFRPDDFVKCGACGRVTSFPRWFVRHKFDSQLYPNKVTIDTGDNVGAQPEAAQPRLVERAAVVDAIADELNHASAVVNDGNEVTSSQPRKAPKKRRKQAKGNPREFDAETMRQIEKAAAEVLRDEKLKRRGQ